MQKKKIRKIIGIRRRLISNFQKLHLDILVYLNLKKFLSKLNFNTVFVYMSLPYEVDTSRIINYLSVKGKRICVPKIVDKIRMIAGEYRKDGKLKRNRFGILEPKETIEVNPSDIDVCIIPLLAFDQNLNRIGFGKGYYDRFLKEVGPSCLKVGVAYHFQKVPKIPSERHDVKLDVIVTDRFILTRENKYRGEYNEKDTT
ncbi:5-formyltetrahydrofolate cyclo-ligase [Caldicellulosiruptor saccharolyticus DSM 8903]|uniref:5-formyltetrahydrofolate cyclo-ligase n=1 Tax=Caldicellulosiruptor saccharolyticus (strain ATCC 43494 / DSM 8903 / Tp8T 6331) TaxID=351627 RepID=A4XKH5_CALS8|nr:5-formyltetrahydrofolate cyclo-ligase [Caldicellulosiruptor saccharolyticus]ABP67410.1 5-formyltetrahydrofolate cyclo-ligase [Caldicellulosiruptor saccharolyticus DSM 8903]